MEFDKSKVYTAINADELKVGSKVILADTLEELKYYAIRRNQSINVDILREVRKEDVVARFGNGMTAYTLAYLVEEPEENKLRWIDLKVGDVITNDNLTAMITEIDKEHHMHICAGHKWYSDEELEDWEKVEE